MPFKGCIQYSCGCTETLEDVLQRQDDYFSQDLVQASNEEINTSFEEELNETIYGPSVLTKAKVPKGADKAKYIRKLAKIRRKWNDYKADAAAAGLDVTDFCDETCAENCFTAAENVDVPVSNLLTQCIIQ